MLPNHLCARENQLDYDNGRTPEVTAWSVQLTYQRSSQGTRIIGHGRTAEFPGRKDPLTSLNSFDE